MKLTTYDGNEITVTKEEAMKLANVANLIQLDRPGGAVYISPKNISSITQGGDAETIKKLTEGKKNVQE